MLNYRLSWPATLGCLILLPVGWLSCGPAAGAQDGKTAYAVVSPQDATEAEAFAARELADYLG